MKYKTIIEVICDDVDAENALNMAGEYLRGNIDSGVYMNCRTISLSAHNIQKICVTLLGLAFLVFALFFKVGPLEGENISKSNEEIVLAQ